MPLQETTLSFLEKHPVEAAGLLQEKPPKHTCTLLNNVPFNIQIQLFQAIQPRYCAELCELVSQEQAQRWLEALPIAAVAAVLQYITAEKRKGFLQAFPLRKKNHCESLLFPEHNSVGEKVNAQIHTLSPNITQREALSAIQQTVNTLVDHKCYSVDANGQLQGYIDIPQLLRAPPQTLLQEILIPPNEFLYANVSLQKAQQQSAWKNHNTLPVVNHTFTFLGIVRHQDLYTYEKEASNTPMTFSGNLIMEMSTQYLRALPELLSTFANLLNEKNNEGNKNV